MSWEMVPIGEVARVQGGYSFKSSDWQEIGIPVVKIANVRDGYLDMSGCSFVSDEVASQACPFLISAGDILIGMTGYVGSVARARECNLPALMNQRVGRFRFRGDPPVDEAFFFRTIRLPEIKERFEQLAGGSAQANLSGSQIESVEIPLPDIDEQRRIGRLLESLDTSVGLCRDHIATLDTLSIAALRWAEAEAADSEAAL